MERESVTQRRIPCPTEQKTFLQEEIWEKERMRVLRNREDGFRRTRWSPDTECRGMGGWASVDFFQGCSW
jgi:hypothetical protein